MTVAPVATSVPLELKAFSTAVCGLPSLTKRPTNAVTLDAERVNLPVVPPLTNSQSEPPKPSSGPQRSGPTFATVVPECARLAATVLRYGRKPMSATRKRVNELTR